MLRIAIVMGSTHTGRLNDAVARWVYDVARTRKDADFELVDIAEYHLPLLDEAIPPTVGQYGHDFFTMQAIGNARRMMAERGIYLRNS